MENKTSPYFTVDDLSRFKAAENKTLKKVKCYLWQNSSNPADVVELIDRIELEFEGDEKLELGCNRDGDGLDCSPEDMQKTAAEVKNEFDGKIKIFVLDASTTSMWQDLIGKKLSAVQLTKESDYYKADSAVFNFNGEMRVVSIHPLDGLVIDYFEAD